MAAHRILLIENPASLSVSLGRLRVRRHEHEDAFIGVDEIAVIVLHHPAITATTAVFQVAARSGIAVLVTDDRHMPAGIFMPAFNRPRIAQRLPLQVERMRSTWSAEVWSRIVSSRLLTEAHTLVACACKGALRLRRLAAEVQPGDPTNVEAQAARHYWRHLFGTGFRRSGMRADDPTNAALNYGYAVLRASVAREICAAGLHPSLACGHAGSENPFNLADDLMEPYRFMVERAVKRLTPLEDFDARARVEVLSCFEGEVALGDTQHRASSALRVTVDSYCRALEHGRPSLLQLPG